MKKLFILMLALVMVASLNAVSFAQTTVKFSGEYYAAGMYLDRTALQKDTGTSTAFYFQRLRLRTDFTVAPGLKVIVRLDAMERAWGSPRSNPTTTLAADSAATRAENENIALDWAYVSYKSSVGVFDVGYMNYGTTGTVFGNNTATQPRIKYTHTIGAFTISPAISKVMERSSTANVAATTTDRDRDVYHLLGVYKWKTGLVGLNINYYNYADSRTAGQPFKRQYFLITPYTTAKIGPVALQAEFNYLTGKDKYEDNGVTPDVTLENISAWIDATAALGMFYAGGSIAYVSGNDPSSTDKIEGGILNGGRDWSPCLIMWNYERTNWAGNLRGANNAAQDTSMANGWFFQLRGGVKPIDKLDVGLSISYANQDKKFNVNSLYHDYGWEVDLTATYKITPNLSYMAGGGYLFAGKYYKGYSDANETNNDYLLIHKLTVTF